MRRILIATLSAGALLTMAAVAQAMPFGKGAPSTDSGITLVAGGCGPGFHRGPYGGCRPNGYGPRFGRPFYGRPSYGRPPFVPRPRPYGYRYRSY